MSFFLFKIIARKIISIMPALHNRRIRDNA